MIEASSLAGLGTRPNQGAHGAQWDQRQLADRLGVAEQQVQLGQRPSDEP